MTRHASLKPALVALAGLAACVLLSACGSRAPAALKPATPVADTQNVDMLVVTTRRPVDDASQMFGGERRLAASYARLSVSLPLKRQTGEVIWPDQSPADPSRTFATTRADVIDHKTFEAALRASHRGRGGRQVLVFVHGYNTRFDEAAFRFAQITADTGGIGEVKPILFSWPSWGSVSAYPYDRESAVTSRDALADLLEQLARDPSIGHVAILAHSMGGFLTMEALRTVALRQGRVPAKIGDLMLAAPDIDVDVAAAQGRALGLPRPRITLFTSRDDQALRFSRFAWGSRDRLGSLDPSVEPYHSRLAEAGVQVIDLSSDASKDRLRHGKFAESPRAVQAIGARLAAGDKLGGGADSAADSLATVTQGAARVIGNVVTAPLQVLSDTPAPSHLSP
jgi:esterase/lipase superfamily enzyme